MNCSKHHDREAKGMCVRCNRLICEECAVKINNKYYCKECVSEMYSTDNENDNTYNNNSNNMNWNMQSADGLNVLDNMTNCNNMQNWECNQSQATREEMMERIKSLNFAITELGLYLDTHVDDQKALCLHRKYCKEYRELTDKYQKVYGPLTIQFPCNKWRWIEEPWPWERGNF